MRELLLAYATGGLATALLAAVELFESRPMGIPSLARSLPGYRIGEAAGRAAMAALRILSALCLWPLDIGYALLHASRRPRPTDEEIVDAAISLLFATHAREALLGGQSRSEAIASCTEQLLSLTAERCQQRGGSKLIRAIFGDANEP